MGVHDVYVGELYWTPNGPTGPQMADIVRSSLRKYADLGNRDAIQFSVGP